MYKFTKLCDEPLKMEEFNEVVLNETDDGTKGTVHSLDHEFPGLTDNEEDILKSIIINEGIDGSDFTMEEAEKHKRLLSTFFEEIVEDENGNKTQEKMKMLNKKGELVEYKQTVKFFFESDMIELDKKFEKEGKSFKYGRYADGIILSTDNGKRRIITNFPITNYSKAKANGENLSKGYSQKEIDLMKTIDIRKHGGETHFYKTRIASPEAKKKNAIDTATIWKSTDLKSVIPSKYANMIRSGNKVLGIYIPMTTQLNVSSKLKPLVLQEKDFISLLINLKDFIERNELLNTDVGNLVHAFRDYASNHSLSRFLNAMIYDTYARDYYIIPFTSELNVYNRLRPLVAREKDFISLIDNLNNLVQRYNLKNYEVDNIVSELKNYSSRNNIPTFVKTRIDNLNAEAYYQK